MSRYAEPSRLVQESISFSSWFVSLDSVRIKGVIEFGLAAFHYTTLRRALLLAQRIGEYKKALLPASQNRVCYVIFQSR